MDNEVFESIIDEYEALRSTEKKERDKRVEEVYERVPELVEIDRKIAQIGSSTLKTIFSNPENTSAKEEMRSKFKILSQRRKEILKKNNIPENFDQIHYRCEKCKDTGYIENVGRCSCFRQKMIDRLYKQSKMSNMLIKQNFDTFRLDYYSNVPVKEYKKTPYENMKTIKVYCEKFAQNFDEPSKSIIFRGDTGLGKTFMSSCIAKYLMDRGKTVIYIRAVKLFRMLEDDRFGRSTDNLDDVYKADLLIIDDLGTEAEYKNNTPNLLEIMNERLINGKKIIINTNLNFEQLENRYTKRFTSRILESFDMLFFYGEDIRRQKLFKKS